MDQKLAKAILPLVNDTDHYQILQMYIENRIEILRDYLEKTEEHSKMMRIQGQINELRAFQYLREQALEMAKSEQLKG